MGGIPALVDLRALCGTVRDQGARQSCLACAASDAHGVGHGLAHALSAEYLFYYAAQRMPGASPHGGLSFHAADQALRCEGQPDETLWPYQPVGPSPWLPPPVLQVWRGNLQTVPPSEAEVFHALYAGSPVILGLKMVPGFRRVQVPPYIVDPTGTPAGGHAVVAVGVGRRPGALTDDLVMVRNSWGLGWGCEGHAWLPREYLKDKLVECSTVNASTTP